MTRNTQHVYDLVPLPGQHALGKARVWELTMPLWTPKGLYEGTFLQTCMP